MYLPLKQSDSTKYLLFNAERVEYLTEPHVWILICEYVDGIQEIDGVYTDAETAQMSIIEEGTFTWSWIGTDFAYTETFENVEGEEYRYTVGRWRVLGPLMKYFTMSSN